jgi:ribosomal protein S18 acetylase RimI-like enzyme
MQRLTPTARSEVEALRTLCQLHDGLELPLYLEPARPIPGDETNQFLFYTDGRMVGFASLQPDEPPEVMGMVHPDHRRKGMGRMLLQAVEAECRSRGVSALVLVAEESSPSGIAFAEAAGRRSDFSEYRMELDPTATRHGSCSALALEPATVESIEELAHIREAAFGGTEQSARKLIEAWFQSPDQRFYLGRRGGEAVGSLRVFAIPAESTVYIHTFGVLPGHQGRGYGRRILLGTLDRLLAEGWEHIRLEVSTENRNALSLYRSCGFREITTFRYYDMPV